jgi:hypothetical protein
LHLGWHGQASAATIGGSPASAACLLSCAKKSLVCILPWLHHSAIDNTSCWVATLPISVCNLGRPVGKTALGKTTLYRLRDYGVPASWVRLVMYVASVAAPVRDLDLLELFAGQGMLHKSAKLLGLASMGMDKELNPKHHDLLTTTGLMHAIRAVLRLRVNSLLFLGIPCSSWVWMNRGTSKRSKSNPLGDSSVPSVDTTNRLTSRCVLLIMTAIARGATWLLEQPASSLLPHHPRVEQLRQLGRGLVSKTPTNTVHLVCVCVQKLIVAPRGIPASHCER